MSTVCQRRDELFSFSLGSLDSLVNGIFPSSLQDLGKTEEQSFIISKKKIDTPYVENENDLNCFTRILESFRICRGEKQYIKIQNIFCFFSGYLM